MTKPIETILEKEMDRKEFIAVMGLGLASIMGLSTIIHMLTGKSLDHHVHGLGTSSFGYSAGPYGGGKE